jgi:hypothetical protein
VLSNISCSPDRSLLISCNECGYTCDVHWNIINRILRYVRGTS